uniref:Sulfate transporter n=1 Tax=Solanum tuberosum TaxID=4113 RepID=M1DSD5_SOLTU
MNMLYLSGPYLPLAIKTGIVSGILALTEGIAVERTFSALKNYQVDGNKEMMAIGLMNMAGSCSSCYVTTDKFYFYRIIFSISSKLQCWGYSCANHPAVSNATVLLHPHCHLSLAIAVGVSVFKILLHVTRPNTGVLGNIPGTHVYQNMNRYRTAVRIPSFLILAVEAPIYFANSTYLQERRAASRSGMVARPPAAADRGSAGRNGWGGRRSGWAGGIIC